MHSFWVFTSDKGGISPRILPKIQPQTAPGTDSRAPDSGGGPRKNDGVAGRDADSPSLGGLAREVLGRRHFGHRPCVVVFSLDHFYTNVKEEKNRI